MNEVKGQEVRTSNMGPGADARYLTYGRLNGRFEYNKNIYHGKWERYSDGTSRLVKYVEPRKTICTSIILKFGKWWFR